MTIRIRIGLFVAAAVVAQNAGTLALALGQTSNAELADRIEKLTARVAELEAHSSRASADRVLADAERHSQLFDVEGFTAGYSHNRFFVASADGSFSLKPFAQFQIRSVTAIDENATENGFDLRRMKFGFDGNLFGNDLYYYFLWETGDTGGSVSLKHTWVKYHLAESNLSLRAGQSIDLPVHEQVTSSKYQLAADRTLANQLVNGFNEALVQFASVQRETDTLREELGVHDGLGSANSDFRDFPARSANFGVSGRVEFKPEGSWSQYDDFSALGNTQDVLVLGIGVDWTQAGGTDTILHTIDAQWENASGLSAYAAYYGSYVHNDGNEEYSLGVLVQAGYVIPQSNCELFARYDFANVPDAVAVGDAGETEDRFHEITAGANYFLHGHAARFTLDFTWLPNGTPAEAGLGFNSSDDDEFVIRGQFQLLL